MGEYGDGVSTASGEEEDGVDRRHFCSRFKMKPMLTSSSFRYKERGHGSEYTRGRRTAGEDGDGVSTASGEEEDGSDLRRRHVCSR